MPLTVRTGDHVDLPRQFAYFLTQAIDLLLLHDAGEDALAVNKQCRARTDALVALDVVGQIFLGDAIVHANRITRGVQMGDADYVMYHYFGWVCHSRLLEH